MSRCDGQPSVFHHGLSLGLGSSGLDGPPIQARFGSSSGQVLGDLSSIPSISFAASGSSGTRKVIWSFLFSHFQLHDQVDSLFLCISGPRLGVFSSPFRYLHLPRFDCTFLVCWCLQGPRPAPLFSLFILGACRAFGPHLLFLLVCV